MRVILKHARRRGLIAASVRGLPSSNDKQTTINRRDAQRQIVTITQRRNEDTMTNLRRFGPINKFIKLEDLKDRPPLVEKIGLVKPENGKFGERLVLTFEPSGRKTAPTSISRWSRSRWPSRLVISCRPPMPSCSLPCGRHYSPRRHRPTIVAVVSDEEQEVGGKCNVSHEARQLVP